MIEVKWTLPALSHLEDIQDFIAADNPRAADRFVNELIDRTNDLLSRNPNAGRPGRVARTRELVLAGTPCIIAYRIRDAVEILAVMHGAQRWPDKFE